MKKFFALILCVLTFSLPCAALEVSARSAILYEPATDSVLFEKNIHERRAIASTTKIMTAVVVLENADVSELVTVPESCAGIEGTSMYLKAGEKLSVSDLLYGMLLQSGNDAANTLAYHVGDGDISRFVEMMNETAERIGLSNTNFKNPSGLPDDEHYSTAFDMALLAEYALEVEGFSEIVSTKQKNVAGRVLVNHNKLLRGYNGANGFKTGYTKVAGRCLVSGALRDNMQLIAITLSAPDDWNDHKKLFDFGFSNFLLYKDSPSCGETSEVSVVGGDDKVISVSSAGEVSLLHNESDEIERVVYLPRFIYAPISRGDVVGKVEYYKNGECIEVSSLISCDTVAEYRKPSIFKRIFQYILQR